MYVQAVLLRRKGVGSFDPVSDGFLVFCGEPADATYYTWRKGGEPLPSSIKLAGVFLGDGSGNFVYEGCRNQPAPGYVASIRPKLKGGYEHSEFHRLFAPPQSADQLLRKVTQINQLYFDTAFVPEPYWQASSDFNWQTGDGGMIAEVRFPAGSHGRELSDLFYRIVRSVKPDRLHNDPRVKTTAKRPGRRGK